MSENVSAKKYHQNATQNRTPAVHGEIDVRLKDAYIKNLPLPSHGYKIYKDCDQKGFGIRVTANGAKTFTLTYTLHGRERRMSIGDFPTWTTVAAREQAKELRRMVDSGTDPLQQKQDKTNAPTVRTLWEYYAKTHLPTLSKHSQVDQQSMFKNYILPAMGTTKLTDVKYHQIQSLHASFNGRVRGNRILEVVRKAFNLAVRLEWIAKNPCQGIKWNHEEPRHRYLTQDEIKRLFEVLAVRGDDLSAAAVKLLILTGARRGELLRATWSQFDLTEAVWVKPSSHTKQKREHRIPLSEEAVQLLRRIKKGSKDKFVFPGRWGNEHQTDLKKFWDAVRTEAGITDVRLHDLRHTYASILVSSGASLPMIGAMLGHTQPSTTARYAHLFDKPLRAATEQVSQFLKAASEVEND